MRKSSMALMYGDFQELRVDDNIFAYSRNYFGETVWIIFNKGKTTSTFLNERLAGKETVLFGNQPSNKTKALSIDIEPWSFAIIKWNN
jgi:hypothetical protein